MRCHYCVSEIPDEALVCSVCRRDLYLVKPLLEKIAALETQVAMLAQSGPAPVGGPAAEAAAEPGAEELPPLRHYPLQALAAWLAPVALLVVAHWLLIFVYDGRVLYLRLLALVLPLPFGYLFARAARLPFAWGLAPALAMAGAAVFAMSAVTGSIDGVPVLPQSMLEVREFIEFAASIGLSFITGLWLWEWRLRRTERLAQLAAERRQLGGMAAAQSKRVAESLTRLNDIGSAGVALATTAFSIYTGLKGVLGS